MIINENGWGNKPKKEEVKKPVLEETPKEEVKESIKAKKIKQLNAGDEDAKQE